MEGVCKRLLLGSTPSQTNPIHALFLWDILCIILLCASVTPVAFLSFRIIRLRFCMCFKRYPLYTTLPSHLITRTHTVYNHLRHAEVCDGTLGVILARIMKHYKGSLDIYSRPISGSRPTRISWVTAKSYFRTRPHSVFKTKALVRDKAELV